MQTFVEIILAIYLTVMAYGAWIGRNNKKRDLYIQSFLYPRGVLGRVHKKHPYLKFSDVEQAAQALRHFFLAYRRCGFQSVAMPSQIVDEVWHEFILSTHAYQQFCQQAFGRFLHHQPAEVLSSVTESNLALRRVWYQSCVHEQIKPDNPDRLPLLFALDAQLLITTGFYYVMDCSGVRRHLLAAQEADGVSVFGVNYHGGVVHCAGDFADPALFGGDSSSCGCGGSGCSGGDSGCSGGCGGGCGGD